MKLCCLWLALFGFTAFGASTIVPSGDLTVHEWGTFTSVAGQDGQPVVWMPLTGASDLPCFVNRVGGRLTKSSLATVRMETPVLYFYAPRRMTASVRVRLPQGAITEWYPRASKVQPALNQGISLAEASSTIEWSPVEVLPDAHPDLPVEKAPSHYYAARETDAAALRVGGQHEKLIFYRGIANFAVPLAAVEARQGNLALDNTARTPIPAVIVFENRQGRIGYRRIDRLEGKTTVAMPELTGSLDALRREIEEALVAQGLYAKEAHAMVETWRDSWFEEGTRVFYIAPRAMVDAVLPLTVDPVPASVARVFVGRIEMLTPRMREEIDGAISSRRFDLLEKYGRFLQPYLNDMGRAHPDLLRSPGLNQFLDTAYDRIQREFDAGCIK